MTGNPFHKEWRDCLRAHFLYVIRSGDRVTEPSLRLVMLEAGFSDEELAELRVQATLRVEDAPPGFVPDLDALRVYPAAVPPVPAEAAPEPDSELAEPVMETDAAETLAGPLETDAEPQTVDEPADAADLPQQLSLF